MAELKPKEQEVKEISSKLERLKKFVIRNLLPCPFCGEDEYLFIHQDKETKDSWVHCCYCDCCGPMGLTKKEAIDAWNKRSK